MGEALVGADVEKAKKLLQNGELVGIPTETVYGLAANAYNSEAVARIFEAKKRPSFDPLIVHTDALEKVQNFVIEIPSKARKLAEAYWPGPLTLILSQKNNIPDLVTSGLPTVGVRIPSHPLTLSLLGRLDFPLAAPSANPFGFVSPTTADHVAQHLADEVAYILDGGICQVGIESTIVSFQEENPVVLRKGGLAIEDLQKIIGSTVIVRDVSTSSPQAPGMLQKHYSPGVPLVLGNIKELLQTHQGKKVAVLSFQEPYLPLDSPLQKILSPKGNLAEAARQLFGSLRFLGELFPDIILSEFVPEKGLGVAINDRLRRAAAS